MHPPPFGGPMGGAPHPQFATPARPSAPSSMADDDEFGDFGSATPSAPTPMPRAPPPTPAGPVPHGVSKDHAIEDDLFTVRGSVVVLLMLRKTLLLLAPARAKLRRLGRHRMP